MIGAGRRREWRGMTRATPLLALLACVLHGASAVAGAHGSSLSPRIRDAVDLGRAAPAEGRHVVVGLALRDRPGLDAFLAEVTNPLSPRYRDFLTPEEVAAAFAPSPEAEHTVVAHLEVSGLVVTERFPNRMLVGAVGPSAAVERAFGVELHDVMLDGVHHFAATSEPVLPASVAAHVAGVLGLDDLAPVHSHVRARPAAMPRAAVGRNCCHLGPADVTGFYDVPAGADGSGETLVVAGVYRWRPRDLAAFDLQWGLPDLPPGSGQVCTGNASEPGCRFNHKRSLEAALDVEYAHAMAPGARVVSYMAASRSLADLAVAYDHIVTDDPGTVVVTSWGACEADVAAAIQQVDDGIFASGSAMGQAWFAASGDNGSLDCRGDHSGHRELVSVDHPANSPHVVGVGGTTPACAGAFVPGDAACAGYGGETAWQDSGGGVSQLFGRPAFQAGCGLPEGTERLVPDVALEANPEPGNYMVTNGHWFIVGGTSAAVAMWGGLFADVIERTGGAAPGPPGPRLYALCGTEAFHDVTMGSNGAYQAGPGYDAVTGLGSPDVAALAASY